MSSLKVLDVQPTDLELQQMATLSAIKGKQFSKDVYSSIIKFKDLEAFLHAFPEVQRQLNQRKVNSIKRYILSGLERNSGFNMRFFSSMTVTCRGTIFYDETAHRIAIDTNRSKLSINDGQHRAQAITETLVYLEKEFVKSKDKMKTSRIRSYIEELKDMVIPVVIYDGLTRKEEKQLFHDLNNLSGRPSKNANIRLNQTDLFARMSRELASENKYLIHYGVEQDNSTLGHSNNMVLLATVYKMIRELLGNEYTHDRDFLNEDNFEKFKSIVNADFDKIFYSLPSDMDIRGKYLIERAFTLKSIARFVTHARNHLDLRLTDDQIFKIIAEYDWSMSLDKWSKYGATPSIKTGNIVFPGGGHGGEKAVYKALMDKATEL